MNNDQITGDKCLSLIFYGVDQDGNTHNKGRNGDWLKRCPCEKQYDIIVHCPSCLKGAVANLACVVDQHGRSQVVRPSIPDRPHVYGTDDFDEDEVSQAHENGVFVLGHERVTIQPLVPQLPELIQIPRCHVYHTHSCALEYFF